MHFHLEIAALLVNLLYGLSISSPICISRAVGHAATYHTDDLQIACRIFMQVIHMALCFVLSVLQIGALAWCFVAG